MLLHQHAPIGSLKPRYSYLYNRQMRLMLTRVGEVLYSPSLTRVLVIAMRLVAVLFVWQHVGEVAWIRYCSKSRE